MKKYPELRPSAPPSDARDRVEGGDLPSGAYPVYAVLMPPPPEEGSARDWHFATEVRRLRPLPLDLAGSVPAVRALSVAPVARARTAPPRALNTAMRGGARRREQLRTARVLVVAVVCGGLLGVLVERVVSALLSS